RLGNKRLAKVSDEHTNTGAHVSRRLPFPEWVPADVMKEAEKLSVPEAERILSAVLAENSSKAARKLWRSADPHLIPLPVRERRSRKRHGSEERRSIANNYRVIKILSLACGSFDSERTASRSLGISTVAFSVEATSASRLPPFHSTTARCGSMKCVFCK